MNIETRSSIAQNYFTGKEEGVLLRHRHEMPLLRPVVFQASQCAWVFLYRILHHIHHSQPPLKGLTGSNYRNTKMLGESGALCCFVPIHDV